MTEKRIVPAGKYPALIKDYGFLKTKKGTHVPFVNLEVHTPGIPEKMTWFGSMSTESSRDFVMKVFEDLGLLVHASNDHQTHWDDFCAALERDESLMCLKNQEASVTIEVVNNYSTNKPESKIKYLNKPAGKFSKVKPTSLAKLSDVPVPSDNFESDVGF